jgi:YggT family protein
VEYLVRIVVVFCDAMAIAIVIRSLLSWFPVDPNNFLVVFLVTITEPILSPLRRIIPRLDAIDLTPMVAILLLMVIAWLIQAYVR